MKAFLIALVAATGLAVTGAAAAQSGADLLKAKGCETCHAMDAKKMGPALKDIAAKNKDNKGAADAIAAKLKDGKGHPKVNASEAEIKTMVTYVLGLK
jgi:cytochrome c